MWEWVFGKVKEMGNVGVYAKDKNCTGFGVEKMCVGGVCICMCIRVMTIIFFQNLNFPDVAFDELLPIDHFFEVNFIGS